MHFIKLQKRVLYSQQSGVVVIAVDLMHFIDSPVYNLNCFLTYKVSGGSQLQLHVGKFMFRAEELFSDAFWVRFQPDTGE